MYVYSKLARVYLRMCPALAAGIFLEQPEPNKPGINLPSTVQHKQLLTSLSNTTNNTDNQSSTIQHAADASPSPPLPLHLIASIDSSTPLSSSNSPPSLSPQPSVAPPDTPPDVAPELFAMNDGNEAVSDDNKKNVIDNSKNTCDSTTGTCHNNSESLLTLVDPLPPETAASSTTIPPLTQQEQQTAPKPLRLGVYTTLYYILYTYHIYVCMSYYTIHIGILSRHIRQGNVAGPLTLGLLAILQSVYITGIEVYILHIEQGYHEGNVLVIITIIICF